MSVNDYDEQLYDAVRSLVDAGLLDDASSAYGIAMQVVHNGVLSLTARQRHVYETEIISRLERKRYSVGHEPD